jgi:hypothetical protein
MAFFEHHLVEEVPELAHETTVQPVIIFVLHTVNHVEVSIKHPRPHTHSAQLVQLSQEGGFVWVTCGAID